MTAVDEIKTRLHIEDLVNEIPSVKLRKSGKNYTGFCPFHENKRTPAFVVFPDSGTWRCFGQCNEGGDIFKFVMKRDGCDFSQALKTLAAKAGVDLEPLTPQRKEEDEHQNRLRQLLEESVLFYQHFLTKNEIGKPALDYLVKRGLTMETLASFGLGYAPEGWDTLMTHFTGRGYTVDELKEAGLVSENPEKEHIYDRFRNRIMIPIRDAQGRMAGFGARILNPNDNPKFLNSPQTTLFDKGRLLFGMDHARKSIREKDQVVIVEGYLDVIILHQAGFTNTVSPMGTALTEDQLRQLQRLTRKMILALDADAAGAKATMRGLEIARQSLDRGDEMIFDARGLLHEESRLRADLRVTAIPEGMDPDEVVLRNPAEWESILKEARPIVQHVMDTLTSGRDLDDPKVKDEIARQIIPLIEDLASPIERDTYRSRLAVKLHINEESLMQLQSGGQIKGRQSPRRQTKPVRREPEGTAGWKDPLRLLENHCLRLLLFKPDLFSVVEDELKQRNFPLLSVDDFQSTEAQEAFLLLVDAVQQLETSVHDYLLDHQPESLNEFMQAVNAGISLENTPDDRIFDDLYDTITRLRLMQIREAIDTIRFLVTDLSQWKEQQVDERESLREYNKKMTDLTGERFRLEKALQPEINFQ
ncbi:DNA primase [Leptolinea tardivitalis]|uniref:DNA primase n=1 Tax=Leptolinea tardivitalis TaxID=229920 RepID=UPI000782CBD6|nr:DNA primase [Leptolinea tardivitalis]GAP22218.1 DNA primase [Leptolinea tardivitalis]